MSNQLKKLTLLIEITITRFNKTYYLTYLRRFNLNIKILIYKLYSIQILY